MYNAAELLRADLLTCYAPLQYFCFIFTNIYVQNFTLYLPTSLSHNPIPTIFGVLSFVIKKNRQFEQL